MRADLERGAERERWSAAEAEAAAARLGPAAGSTTSAPATLVVEAAPEDVELKRELFGRLEDDLRAPTPCSRRTPPRSR